MAKESQASRIYQLAKQAGGKILNYDYLAETLMIQRYDMAAICRSMEKAKGYPGFKVVRLKTKKVSCDKYNVKQRANYRFGVKVVL